MSGELPKPAVDAGIAQAESTLFAIAGERYRAVERGKGLGPSDQEEAIRTTRAVLRAASVEIECPRCFGEGADKLARIARDIGDEWVACATCNGSGRIWVLRTAPEGS